MKKCILVFLIILTSFASIEVKAQEPSEGFGWRMPVYGIGSGVAAGLGLWAVKTELQGVSVKEVIKDFLSDPIQTFIDFPKTCSAFILASGLATTAAVDGSHGVYRHFYPKALPHQEALPKDNKVNNEKPSPKHNDNPAVPDDERGVEDINPGVEGTGNGETVVENHPEIAAEKARLEESIIENRDRQRQLKAEGMGLAQALEDQGFRIDGTEVCWKDTDCNDPIPEDAKQRARDILELALNKMELVAEQERNIIRQNFLKIRVRPVILRDQWGHLDSLIAARDRFEILKKFVPALSRLHPWIEQTLNEKVAPIKIQAQEVLSQAEQQFVEYLEELESRPGGGHSSSSDGTSYRRYPEYLVYRDRLARLSE